MKTNAAKRQPWLWAALACLILVLALDIWYLTGPVNQLYNADSSDTLLWAEATYTSGLPVSKDFYYASMLPFGGHLLMLPFIGAFGVSLATHVIGMVLFWLLLAAAALGAFRALSWSWTESLFSTAFLLLLFGASRSTRFMYFQHIIYYSLGLFFLLVGLTLLLRVLGSRARAGTATAPVSHTALWTALLLIWILLTATDGATSLTAFILPCLGAYALERLLCPAFRLTDRAGRRSMGFFLLMAAAAVAGLWLRKELTAGTLGGEYGAYTSTFSPEANWAQNLAALPFWWISLWSSPVEQVSFLSVSGVLSAFGIACALLFALLPLAAIPLYARLETRWERLAVLVHFLTSILIIFAAVFGMIGERLYFCQATSVLCTLVVLRWALRRGALVWKRFAALALAALCLFACVCGLQLFQQDDASVTDTRRIVATNAFLEEQGLHYGYATFWNCNSATVLSSGRVKIRPVTYKESWQQYIPDTYQSAASWYTEQADQARYFLMLSQDEAQRTQAAVPQDVSETLTFDRYIIYVYDHFPFSNWLE